jgi:hypothetical protein
LLITFYELAKSLWPWFDGKRSLLGGRELLAIPGIEGVISGRTITGRETTRTPTLGIYSNIKIIKRRNVPMVATKVSASGWGDAWQELTNAAEGAKNLVSSPYNLINDGTGVCIPKSAH